MAFRYVRAIHDFIASNPDEITLQKGDVAQIVKELGAHWMHGIVHQKWEGVFPVNFVEPLKMPLVDIAQKVFAATEDFHGGEEGDLCFRKGDLLVGTAAVDHNWWEGFAVSSHMKGIFPLTHVEQLYSEASTTAACKDRTAPDHRDKVPSSDVLHEAIVVSNLVVQVEDELSLIKGDAVEVLEIFGDGFALGCCRGKIGRFPLSYVQVLDQRLSCDITGQCLNQSVAQVDNNQTTIKHLDHAGSEKSQQSAFRKSHSRKGSYTQANTRSHDSFVMPYAQTRFPFEAASENELSFGVNEIVTLISHVDDDWTEGEINGRRGIFPTSFVNVIVDCQPFVEVRDRKGTLGTGGASFEKYGRVLYNFFAENPEELDLKEGDTVTILQQLDAEWYLAQHDDNRIGRCPMNYVEVFESEPLHGATTPSAVGLERTRSHPSFATCDISPTMTDIKPKPAVKPKPILKTSKLASQDCLTASAFKPHELKRELSGNNSVQNILNGSLHSPMQKLSTNVHSSFDDVALQANIQSGSQEGTYRTKFANENVQMITPQQSSVSVFRNETTQDSYTKSGVLVFSEASEYPVPAPRISRPTSLGITGKSELPETAKKKPPPPPRPTGSTLSPLKPKIVPKRPAPPCPSSVKPNRSQSHNDLMIFSPDPGSSDALRATCSTPAMESSTHSLYSGVSSGSKSLEMPQTDEKRHEKRQHIITELIQTESDYVNSIVLCLKIFSSRSKMCPLILDLEMLFGNADEVVELSQRLLASLEQNVEAKPFEMQCVGKCFVELKDQFQRVYAPYCRNHDSVIALLEKCDESPEISEFIRDALDQMRKQSQVFDLNSILIKPVQRILKYPLLLSELERSTDDGHLDKQHLSTAISTMTHIAAYINEYKRRKDLVLKYKQETDVKFSDKIGRLTMHSTMKKLSRISRKMVGIQTVDEHFNYQEQRFKALDSAIRNLTKDISQYVEQCQDVLELRELLAVNFSELCFSEVPELKIGKFCEVYSEILQIFCQEFKAEVESDILPPLNSLMLMYQGPHKVIRKRYDKLLDYDNASARLRSFGDSDQAKAADEELFIAQKNYEALNAQLLDDLPKLYDLSMKILCSCLVWFISIQQCFLKKAVDKIHDLFRLPFLLGSSPNIIEAFNIAHAIAVEKMSDLSFIPRTFNPQADELRKMKERRSTGGGTQMLIDFETAGSQCEGQRSYLKQKYPSGRLFWVSRDFTGGQTMDLNLLAGTLVAVIKEGDPMGNRDRWFVDNGADKGFVLKQFLSGQKPAASAFPSNLTSVDLLDWLEPLNSKQPKPSSFKTDNSGSLLGTTTFTSTQPASDKKNWVKCDDDDLSQSTQSSQRRSSSCSNSSDNQADYSKDFYFRAIYDFHSRGSNELTVNEGQIVHVLQKHDLDGNSEWWHVEREDGQRGYVPANYLYAVQ